MRATLALIAVAVLVLATGRTVIDGQHRAGQAGTTAGGPYRFTATSPDGSPARWNPCADHLVFADLTYAPAGAAADLVAALARADALSGLRFHLAGTTPAELARSWLRRAAGSTARWPPITVRWTAPSQRLTIPDAAAETTPIWLTSDSGQLEFVTATILFNTADAGLYSVGARGGFSLRALAEHEIGHLLGLGHVDDPAQIMYPDIGQVGNYGPGDRAGLRRLGQGGCLRVPQRPNT